jgi:hypothetical protein
MKSFLTVLLVISSSVTFAARLPTVKELLSYEDQIRNSSSISSILRDIKNGKIDPIVSLDRTTNTIYVEAGVSEMAYTLIKNRFDVRKPLGNEQENLDLLYTIIKSGVNLNYLPDPKFDENIRSLMDEAATTCSPSAVNILIKNGANPALEDFYWVKAFNQWLDSESGSQFEKNCLAVADLLSDKSNSLGMYAIEKLFFPKEDRNSHLGSFSQGANLAENFTQKMKDSLENNLGIKLSKLPDGDEPSKDWYKVYYDSIAVARGQDYRNVGQDWWNDLTDTEKAWACYYSSFDEALTAYHNLGITDETLTTKSVGGSYVIFAFDKFPVYVFGPYCNSIK